MISVYGGFAFDIFKQSWLIQSMNTFCLKSFLPKKKFGFLLVKKHLNKVKLPSGIFDANKLSLPVKGGLADVCKTISANESVICSQPLKKIMVSAFRFKKDDFL